MTSINFLAAQERVLARRAAREADERQRLDLERSQLSSSISQLPFPLNRLSGPVNSTYNYLRHRDSSRPIFRVGQVDAELLDEELLVLLKEQVGDALKYFGPHISDDWSQEILLALRAVLFKLSVWDHGASYGAVLQNLRLTDARTPRDLSLRPSRWQKGLYGAVTVLGRYGWEKWEGWLAEQSGDRADPSHLIHSLMRATNYISTTHSIAAFISFLVFLINGRYRTLTDRLFRLRLAPASSQLNREISFEYLNRQLVWHALTEFLLFLLPLVGIARWRRWLSRTWQKMRLALKYRTDESPENGNRTGPLAHLPENACAICYRDQHPENPSEADILGGNVGGIGHGVIGSSKIDVVNPYQGLPCQCVYCFVCVATKLDIAEGDGWSCLRCGQLIKTCQPWDGDVSGPQKSWSSIERPQAVDAQYHDRERDLAVKELRSEDEEHVAYEEYNPT